MPINTPLIKNNRFEILRTENKNTFGQRRTRSSPSLNRAHHNNVIDGQSLRRINSARFETRTHKKYKAPLSINDINAFPVLNNTCIIKQPITTMNYTEATQNLCEVEDEKENTIKEGWVRLIKYNNKIKIEYGPQKEKPIYYEEEFHDRAQRHLYHLVVRWQNERDDKNELLGDMSPYWNEPSLLEPLDEDLYDSEEEYDN